MPNTPKPWFNYLANKYLLSPISNIASGASLVKDSDGNIYPLLSAEHSRIIYVRDNDTGEFWNLNWVPTKNNLDYFEAKHGLGYAQLSSSNTQIECSLIISQAKGKPMEIWQIKIGNGGERKRRLSIFVTARWAYSQPPEQQKTGFYKRILYNTGINSPEFTCLTHFITSSAEIEDYDGLQDNFLGPYGNFAAPQVVVSGKSSKSKGTGQMGIGCLHKTIALGAKATHEFTIFVGGIVTGQTQEPERIHTEVQAMIKPYLKPGSVAVHLQEVSSDIRSELEHQRLSLPEPELSRYYNYFLPYQALLRADWPTVGANNASTSHAAILSAVSTLPEKAESILFDMLAHQLKDGRVANSWQGNKTSITAPSNIIDSILLAESVAKFVMETGDISLLQSSADYLDGGEGSILEHLIKAVNQAIESQDSTGLVACSTAVTGRLINLIKKLEPILEKAAEDHLAKKYRQTTASLSAQIEKMWMSPWYSYGKTSGNRNSTSATEHGFDLDAQSWAIISSASKAERAKQLIDKLAKQSIAQPPLNFSPAYKHFRDGSPESSSAPGTILNSAVDAGLVISAIEAATLVKNADVAWRWFKQICAIYAATTTGYGAEPFWQMTQANGPESDQPGAATTRFTNGAGSLLSIFTEHILGIQPTLDGLQINPCIPKNWRGLEISRRFRGASYQFRIENPFRVSAGVDRIIVDGIRITGTTIRPFSGGLHFVEIVLG